MHADGKSTLASVSKWNSGKVNSTQFGNRSFLGMPNGSQLKLYLKIADLNFTKTPCGWRTQTENPTAHKGLK